MRTVRQAAHVTAAARFFAAARWRACGVSDDTAAALVAASPHPSSSSSFSPSAAASQVGFHAQRRHYLTASATRLRDAKEREVARNDGREGTADGASVEGLSLLSFLDGDNGEVLGATAAAPAAERVEARERDAGDQGSASAASDRVDPPASPPPPPVTLVTVRLHNLPKNWMHEDVVEFIHAVAQHAGIPAPPPPSPAEKRTAANADDEEDESSAIPKATSPFVHRLSIPFGRRTGLIYGEPRITVTSQDLADYLVKELRFDPDDYRSRIYFSREADAGEEGSRGSKGVTSFEEVEESVEEEQAEALRTLELDRYLMAPDLLLDIAKMHQRRLVTANEKVLVDAFLDDEDDVDDDELEGEDEAGEEPSAPDASDADPTAARTHPKQKKKKKGTRTGKRRTAMSASRPKRRAGDLKSPGRGSMHNMPIPKPYIQGRSL